jgi:hypothetical protein
MMPSDDKQQPPKKCRISASAMAEVKAALRDYAQEVLKCGYGKMAANMHVDKADLFVRWMNYQFTPGCRLDGGPRGNSAKSKRGKRK